MPETPFEDHFRRPRHVGDLVDATARARADNPVCGDRLSVSLRLDAGRVSAIAWRSDGCSGTIAAASAMSELALGRDLAAARTIDARAIDRALGGLPAAKRHGADLAADALGQALTLGALSAASGQRDEEQREERDDDHGHGHDEHEETT